MENFTTTNLKNVLRWLDSRREFLESERMIIECGDDLAHTNGKWPRVTELRSEENAIRHSIATVRAQIEEGTDEKNS